MKSPVRNAVELILGRYNKNELEVNTGIKNEDASLKSTLLAKEYENNGMLIALMYLYKECEEDLKDITPLAALFSK